MAEQAYAYVTLIPVAKGFQSAIAKELSGVDDIGKTTGKKTGDGFANNFGSSIKKMAVVVGGALATIGAGRFFKESITQASDLGESINAVNKAYGDYAADVLKLGDGVAQRLGLTTVDFNAASVRFSAFAERVVGKGGDVAGFVGDITTRAADFASVFNIDVSEALQVFQSGLSGEAEPLKRFGINLLDSEVKAFALANGIGEVGRELTESEKVQARYGLLLQSTAKTAGDFADTSDGLANSQRILQASFTNMQAELGNALVPAFAALSTAMIPVIEQLAPVLADVFNQVAPVITDIAQQLPDLLVGLAPLLPIMGELLTIFLKLVTAVLPLIESVMIPVLEIMADILSSALAPAIQTTFGWMAENTATVAAFFGTLATGVGIIKTVTSWTQIMTKAQAALAAVLAINPWTLVAVAIAAVVAAIVYLATQTTFFQDLWKEMVAFVTGAWDMFVKDFKTGVDGLIGFFKDIAKNFKDFGNLLYKVGEDIIRGLIDGILNGAKNIINTVKNVVSGAVEGVKNFLGIKSPSRVFYEIGENVSQGLANGISDSVGLVEAAGDTLANATNGIANKIEKGFRIVSNIPGMVSSAMQEVIKITEADVRRMAETVEGLFAKFDKKGNLVQSYTGYGVPNLVPTVDGQLFDVGRATDDLNALYNYMGAKTIDQMNEIQNALFGGSFQSAIDTLTGQRSFIDPKTGMSTTISGTPESIGLAVERALAGGLVPIDPLTISVEQLKESMENLAKQVDERGLAPRGIALAKGGYVDQPTPALVGEAGPEVVMPLDRFEKMMGIGETDGKTLNYYAAPNQSLDSEGELFKAMRRAKVVANW